VVLVRACWQRTGDGAVVSTWARGAEPDRITACSGSPARQRPPASAGAANRYPAGMIADRNGPGVDLTAEAPVERAATAGEREARDDGRRGPLTDRNGRRLSAQVDPVTLERMERESPGVNYAWVDDQLVEVPVPPRPPKSAA